MGLYGMGECPVIGVIPGNESTLGFGSLNPSSIDQNVRLRNKGKVYAFFSYIFKTLYEFSIQSVAIGIGRIVFPETCPCTTDVLLHILSTC